MKIDILVLFLILEDRGRILIKDKLKLHMGVPCFSPCSPTAPRLKVKRVFSLSGNSFSTQEIYSECKNKTKQKSRDYLNFRLKLKHFCEQ